MDHTQSFSGHSDDGREKAISDLIESVAEEQEALARILAAEHKKIEKATALCGVDIHELIRIDESVERVLAAVTRLELALQLKLELFSTCLCPDTSCHKPESRCPKA